MDLTLREEEKVLLWLRDPPRWLRRPQRNLRWKRVYPALKNLCPNSLVQLNPSCTSTVSLSALALSHWSPAHNKNQSVGERGLLWANVNRGSSCMVTASTGQAQLRNKVFPRFCERAQREHLLRIMKKNCRNKFRKDEALGP